MYVQVSLLETAKIPQSGQVEAERVFDGNTEGEGEERVFLV